MCVAHPHHGWLVCNDHLRNDGKPQSRSVDLANAYKSCSEAWADITGMSLTAQRDAGSFVSYIGLFQLLNFDNWTYQPSFRLVEYSLVFQRPSFQYFPRPSLN